MATSKKAVEISFFDLETGRIVKIWRTAELLNYLQISIATFKRDKVLLIKYCPELQLAKRSRVFSDHHRHAFDALRDWREAEYIGESLKNKLAEEGLPPYVDYQTRTKETVSRMPKRRRNHGDFASCWTP
ncbi:MAG: hypothetical protein V7L26_05080 [Nostoc sp.]|uniref:hypothetical protein n=1 Tax=Nostoc sp. TaxID=1180 RepID=UPI002FF3F951